MIGHCSNDTSRSGLMLIWPGPADVLQERCGPADEETAVALLDESLTISSKLGMRPLMERVLSRREILMA